jgi:hypothetical protein
MSPKESIEEGLKTVEMMASSPTMAEWDKEAGVGHIPCLRKDG